MTATPARLAALEVVTRVRERSAYAHETLDTVISASSLSSRDIAFATRLAYGTVACRGTLDEAIARYVDTRHTLESQVSDAMAVAAYEILYTATPKRAAVSEGVELVRSVRPNASRLANAVLRRLATDADDFPWGDPSQDVVALARLHGHPEWLARLWVEELGRERAAAVMAADNEPAPLFLAHLALGTPLQCVLDSLAQDGAEPSTCPVPGCIVAGSPSKAVRSRVLTDKAVVVADAGAQFAAKVTSPVPDAKVVEIGAGRGTKSLMLAGLARMAGGPARVLAVDTHAFKLEALTRSAESLGVTEIETRQADARDVAFLADIADTADAVLVDAPCSGLGTLRRHPDRRWRALPEDMEELARVGSALLRTAARLVKAGGFVVYSTCTIARRENQSVVEEFLVSGAGRGFVVDDLGPECPSDWAHFVTAEGYFQSLPEIGGPDGHFIARLKRGTE